MNLGRAFHTALLFTEGSLWTIGGIAFSIKCANELLKRKPRQGSVFHIPFAIVIALTAKKIFEDMGKPLDIKSIGILTYVSIIAFVSVKEGSLGTSLCLYPLLSLYGIERIKKCYHNIFKANDNNYIPAFLQNDMTHSTARLFVSLVLSQLPEGI